MYQFPPRCGSILGAYWYTSVGKASPFLLGAIIVPSLGLFWYIIVPFLGICFSVPLLVQEMYQKWYILCPGKVHPRPGTIRGSFCAQKWYIT